MTRAQPSETSRRLARNFGWLSLQELLIRLTGLVTAIYLARTLSEANYGALGIALGIAGMAGVLVQAGTGNRATRLTARDPSSVPETYARMMGLRLLAAILVVAVVAALAPALSAALSTPAPLLVLCALPLLRRALTVAWAFRGLDRMEVNAVADVLEKALTLLGLVLLVHGNGNDVLWAPVAEFGAAMVMVGWLRRRLHRQYPSLRLRFRPRDWPPIISEALPLGLASLLSSVYLHSGVLLLGWFAGTESAAGFLVAQKVMLTLVMLLVVINKSAFPTSSRMMARDPRTALDLAGRLMRYYLSLIVPAFLLVAFHAETVLRVLYGAVYAPAAGVLVILLAAMPFIAIGNMVQNLLAAMPRPRDVLVSRALGATILLSLCALWIPRHGAEGAAFALIAGELAGTASMFLFLYRSAGGVPWDASCLAPLGAGALAALLYLALDGSPVALKLPLAALVYLVSALLLGAVKPTELRGFSGLLRSLRPGKARNGRSAEQAGNHPAVKVDPEQESEQQP